MGSRYPQPKVSKNWISPDELGFLFTPNRSPMVLVLKVAVMARTVARTVARNWRDQIPECYHIEVTTKFVFFCVALHYVLGVKQKNDQPRVTVAITKDLHARMKVQATATGMKIRVWLERLIESNLPPKAQ